MGRRGRPAPQRRSLVPFGIPALPGLHARLRWTDHTRATEWIVKALRNANRYNEEKTPGERIWGWGWKGWAGLEGPTKGDTSGRPVQYELGKRRRIRVKSAPVQITPGGLPGEIVGEAPRVPRRYRITGKGMQSKKRKTRDKTKSAGETTRKRKAPERKHPEPKVRRKQTPDERRAARKRGRQAKNAAIREGTYTKRVRRGQLTDTDAEQPGTGTPPGTNEPGVYLAPACDQKDGRKPTKLYYFVQTVGIRKRGYFSVSAYGSWKDALEAAINDSRVRRGLAHQKDAPSKKDEKSGRRGQPPKNRHGETIDRDIAEDGESEGDHPLPVRIGGMRLLAPRAKSGTKRAETGRYNVRVPAAYSTTGKKLDTSFSMGSYSSWRETREAAECAIREQTGNQDQPVVVTPPPKIKKTKTKTTRKRRRKGREQPRRRWIDNTSSENETCLPNESGDPSAMVDEDVDHWWEQGENASQKTPSEEKQQKREEPAGPEQTVPPNDVPQVHRKPAPDPFEEDQGEWEEAPEDHDDMIRLLEESRGGKSDEYQDELEREWAARQDEAAQQANAKPLSPRSCGLCRLSGGTENPPSGAALPGT